MALKICPNCKVRYNEETIQDCPICVYHREPFDLEFRFKQAIKELRICVSLSRKGKHRRQPSGFHLVFDKRFKVKLKKI